MKRAVLALTIVALVCVSPVAHAEGWSWRNWVPFAKKKDDDAKVSKRAMSPFSTGSFLKGSSSRRAGKSSSTVSRMGSSTKRFFSKATDRLTLKKSKPKRKAVSGISGSYDFRKSKPEKKSFFTSWFRGNSRDEPRTAQEWQSQQRPSWGEAE